MDPFIGEIRLMGFDFPPKGWLFCQGQTLPINQNQALFSLLGTQYGGDGVQTFKLPDLRGRVALGMGAGPGLATYTLGQVGGAETVALTPAQLPAHDHTFTGTIKTCAAAEGNQPSGYFPAPAGVTQYSAGASNAAMGGNALAGSTSTAGGSQPHENRQPMIVMNYAIAVQGIFPSRS
ncbi:tail fiber protein [Hymenobacter coalescens]